jgi:hypothetical protein
MSPATLSFASLPIECLLDLVEKVQCHITEPEAQNVERPLRGAENRYSRAGAFRSGQCSFR